jgi:hypothetical protein
MRVQRNALIVAAEAVAIFASILFAFFVENLREDQRQVREMRESIAAITLELQSNREELAAAVERHRVALPAMSALVAELQETGVFPDYTSIPGIGAPELTDIAFSLGRETGALAPLEVEVQLALARAYRAIEEVDENEDNLGRRNAQVRDNDGLQYLSGQLYYFVSAIENGETALDRIDAAFAALEEAGF